MIVFQDIHPDFDSTNKFFFQNHPIIPTVMKKTMTVSSILQLSILVGSSVLLSCARTDKNRLPDPKIEPGTAEVSGRVAGYKREKDKKAPIIGMYYSNPVTAERTRVETRLSDEGIFEFEVPVETNTLGHLFSDTYEFTIAVPLEAGKKVSVELIGDDSIRIAHAGRMKPTPYDMTNYAPALSKFVLYPPDRTNLYEMSPEAFIRHETERLAERSAFALDSMSFSEPVRTLLLNEFKLMILKGRLLAYKESVERNYRNLTTAPEGEPFSAQEPGRSYYSFLRRFDLNDPQYLYNDAYIDVMQYMLDTDSLSIPSIGDTPVPQWLDTVKAAIADLIGFDSGLFYDMLAANAYARQFNTEAKALTDTQRKNIESYFKNGGIARALLAKNAQVVEDEEAKKALVVNDTPEVPDEHLMETIVSKYKGRPVVVDFWATWCGPCLASVSLTKKVRGEMKDRGVVFVYITTESSPREEWRQKIESIIDEHYYLTREQWNHLLGSFGFDGIPSYLFYDRDGALKDKKTGGLSEMSMREKIEALLPASEHNPKR